MMNMAASYQKQHIIKLNSLIDRITLIHLIVFIEIHALSLTHY